MALRYVSPSGAMPPGYAAYYTDLRAALAAVQAADEVVLEKSTAHVWTRGAGLVSLANRSFTIRNEAGDGDFEACCVTLDDNAGLSYSGGGGAAAIVLRGVTLQGPAGGYASFDPAVLGVTSPLRFGGLAHPTELTLDCVRWRRWRWADGVNGALAARGLAFSMQCSAPAVACTFRALNCVFEDLQGPPSDGSGTSWHRSWCLTDIAQATWTGCRFADNGRADRTSAMQGSFNTVMSRNVLTRWVDCHWSDCYCLAPGTTSEPDGGCVCGPFGESALVSTLEFEDCTFSRCEAGKSGAVHAPRGNVLRMTRCVFVDCHARGSLGGGATGRGGTDHANAALNFSVYRACLFLRCTAPDGAGGAIRSVSPLSDVLMECCSFVDCEAPAGNAIAVPGKTAVVNPNGFKLRNCAFISTVNAGRQVETLQAGVCSLDEITHCASYGGAADWVQTQVVPTGTVSGPLLTGAGGVPVVGSPLLAGGADLGYLRDVRGQQCRRDIGAFGAAKLLPR